MAKKTLYTIYNKALNGQIAKARFVAFKFPEGKAHSFHFALIRRGIHYIIFDGHIDRAIVGVQADESTDDIKSIAAEFGGTEYAINLNYEIS